MRLNYKAQSLKQKGMHYNIYHSLTTLAHTVKILHEDLKLFLTKYWAAACAVQVSC